jgi:hypothetical protein
VLSNVIELPVVTKLDIPPERILNKAIVAELQEVLVIGTDKEGSFYFAASFGDGGNVLWLMERAKVELMKITGNL